MQINKDNLKFVKNAAGVWSLEATGYGVAPSDGFYDHLLDPDVGGFTFDELLEGIMSDINSALEDAIDGIQEHRS